MRKKLISYVDNLFSHVPKNAQAREIHDEILLNTLDRYDEELSCGRSEQSPMMPRWRASATLTRCWSPYIRQKSA